MVQRNAPKSTVYPPEKPRKPQFILEYQPSKKLERSIAMKPKVPNYMSPTKSWEKKKEKAQVTTSAIQTPKSSNFDSPNSKKKSPVVKINAKGLVLNRATCSSTLKDSKFPAYLDVDRGVSEVEATSVIRVCPYTYCSLNGHRNENLGTLKSFISRKRKLLKAQKSIRLKSFPSFKLKCLGRNKEENDTGQNCIDKASANIPTEDFFVEIYNSKPKKDNQDTVHGISELSQCEENHMDKKSQILGDDECDHGFNYTKSEEDNAKTHDDEESVVKYHEVNESKTEESKNPISVFDSESKKEVDDAHDDMCTSDNTSTDTTSASEDLDSSVEKECIHENVDCMSHEEGHQLCGVDLSDPVSKLLESYDETENENASIPEINEGKAIIKDKGSKVFKRGIKTEEEIFDKLMSKLRITKKKIEEESYNIRDFNPRSPNFLDVEPDPEAEKVDLKHQTVDERRNSEEWMIDYALQRAVTKLGPAQKKKVALLVKAFEAVAPFEKPMHGRVMQACV